MKHIILLSCLLLSANLKAQKTVTLSSENGQTIDQIKLKKWEEKINIDVSKYRYVKSVPLDKSGKLSLGLIKDLHLHPSQDLKSLRSQCVIYYSKNGKDFQAHDRGIGLKKFSFFHKGAGFYYTISERRGKQKTGLIRIQNKQVHIYRAIPKPTKRI